MWNRHYPAWSEVLEAHLREVDIFHPKWWFTSQLLVTSLTSSAHLSTWWGKKGGGQMCSPVPPQHFGLSHSQADPGKCGHRQLVTKSYLRIISQNASSVSGLLCTICRTLIFFVRQRMVISYLLCNSRAFQLDCHGHWACLSDRDGWKTVSTWQKKLLQQPTTGLWPSLYFIKGSLYSQRASYPTCDLTDPHYLPPSLLTTEEHQEFYLDSSSPYP